MKKLMTVIASVALAFGLYAADSDFKFNQTDFSAPSLDLGPLDLTKNDAGGNTAPFYWAGDAGDSEIKEAENATKFLAIENSAPLYRTVNNAPDAKTQKIGTGVFADMYVKFTASDAADPVVLADGSKLGIWVAADDEAETPSTNLVVCAASLVNGWDAPVATNFTIAVADDFDFTVEHRVTIRAIEEISSAELKMAGFVLYIDEKPVAAADEDYVEKVGFTAFNSVAKPFYDNNQLFVSLVEAGTLSAQTIYGVGFKGTGELSYVGLADYEHAPDFARGAKTFALSWDEGVTGFTADGEVLSGLTEGGTTNLIIESGDTIEVTGVTYANGYMRGEWENGETDDGVNGTFTWTANDPAGRIGAEEVGFTIDGKKYATFEDALAEADGKVIKLAKDFTIDGAAYINIGDEEGEAPISTTIDLAGNDIDVANGQPCGFYVGANSTLAVIDTVGGGKITASDVSTEDFAGVFYSDGDCLIGNDNDDQGITADALIGSGSLTIVKGLFLKDENDYDNLVNYLPEGDEYEVVGADDYWKVQKKGGPEPTFVIEIVGGKKYETIDAALEDATDGDELKLLESVTLDDTLVIDKAIKFEMDGYEIKLAADELIGVDVKAAATIQDGTFTSTRDTYANNAYMILNEAVNATYKNLDIYAANYKFGLTCDSPGDLADECENDPTVTVNCGNVDIIGNGTLFYAQHTILNLDAYCSATKDPTLSSGGYAAAVYSALNATVNLAVDDQVGGAYEHDYALISGNLGGKIYVAGGEFKGDIKSYMKVGAHPELEQFNGYKAMFILNGGTYDGDIVFEDDSDEARQLDSFWKDDEVTTLAAPAGYKWNDLGFLVKDVGPTTYDITIAETENGTLETSVTNGVEVGTEVTVTAIPAQGYELESITTNDAVLAGTTFEMPAENVTVAATFKEISYPSDWPEADEGIKDKFAKWRGDPEKGAGANLDTDAAKNAFLLNCSVNDVTDLKIESIIVNADGTVTVMISAPGKFGFPGPDLRAINGVLFAEAGDTLDTMKPKAFTPMWTTETGKVAVSIKANFIKAVIGFKAPPAEE